MANKFDDFDNLSADERENVAQLKKEHQAALDKVKKELAAKTTEVTNLTADVTKAKQELTEAARQVEVSRAALKVSEDTLKLVQKDKDSDKTKAAKLEKELEVTKKEFAKIQDDWNSKLKAATTKSDQLAAKIKEMQTVEAQLNGRVKELETKIRDCEKREKDLIKKDEDLLKRVSELERKLADKEKAEIALLRKDEDLLRRNSELEKALQKRNDLDIAKRNELLIQELKAKDEEIQKLLKIRVDTDKTLYEKTRKLEDLSKEYAVFKQQMEVEFSKLMDNCEDIVRQKADLASGNKKIMNDAEEHRKRMEEARKEAAMIKKEADETRAQLEKNQTVSLEFGIQMNQWATALEALLKYCVENQKEELDKWKNELKDPLKLKTDKQLSYDLLMRRLTDFEKISKTVQDKMLGLEPKLKDFATISLPFMEYKFNKNKTEFETITSKICIVLCAGDDLKIELQNLKRPV